MLKTETIKILDENNSVYEVLENYTAGTVKVYSINGINNTETSIDVIELGENYLQLVITPPTNSYIKIVYRTAPIVQTSTELYLEVKSLKKEINSLQQEIKNLEKALNNRVNVETFQSWITLIEDSLGIKLDQNLSSLYTTSKVFRR